MFIRRISPFEDVAEALRDLDGLFTRTRMVPAGTEVDAAWTPAVESFRRENEIVLLMELPGVDPEKVTIDLSGQTLTISGEKGALTETQEGHFLSEIPRGRFNRSFKLPPSVKGDDVKASFNNGVLEIAMPLAGAPMSRRIPLQGAEAAGAATTKAA